MAPRVKKRKDPKILKYPDSSMQSAINAVREGRLKIREAAREYGVPHSTLINKLKGRVPERRKMGRDTYLTYEEEKLLSNYIIANAKKGIPLNQETLKDTVKKILDDDNRTTPFTCNRPGRKWIDLFMKRHPDLTERYAEGISKARANVTEADLRGWYHNLKEYLLNEGCLDILDDPSRIFNADESGFQTCPESGKVLGPTGMKNFYEVKSGKEKEQLTVMVNINACGQTVSPMIVYPLVRISKEISGNVPTNWAIGKSPSGWMTGPLYYEYIANIFDPWLKCNNIQKPVLLLIDGHRSHMTMEVSQYCEENKIITYALYPNSTHITQPADVSVFKCLKSGWKKTVFEYKQNTGNRQITRAGFAPLLSKVFQEKVTLEIIANGFKRCGIYPFDPSAVDYTKCMDHEARRLAPKPAQVGVETLLLLESFMRKNRAEQFRQSENKDWQGDESAKELFYVWKKFRTQCLSDEVPHALGEHEVTIRPSTPTYTALVTRSPSTPTSNAAVNTSPSTPIRTAIIMTNLSSPLHAMSPSTPTQTASVMMHQSARTPTTATTTCPSISRLYPSTSITTWPSPRTPHAAICTATSSSVSTSATAAVTTHQSTTTPISTINREIVLKKTKLISPAFGKHIVWPADSPVKTNRVKERLPYAATTKLWQEYWTKKEAENVKKIEEIANKKRKREEKKLEASTTKKKRKIISTESSQSETDVISDESDKEDSLNEKSVDNLAEGDFALIEFSSEKRIHNFLCVIQKTYKDDEELEVMAMKPCNDQKTLFKSDEKDVSVIKKEQIKKIMPTPKMILKGDRIQYKFTEPVDVGVVPTK